jgi:Na+/H+ antiporter NhaD/arsenite permease-like protein
LDEQAFACGRVTKSHEHGHGDDLRPGLCRRRARRIPGLRLDRAGIALTGEALMMAIGAITPDEAYRAIDLDTIALLLGMMIVVAHLKLSGFFRLVAGWALAHAHLPLVLLATVVVTTGALSAFLVNDAVCLVMAPLVIEATRSTERS